jgi:cobalt-zinc-cadmium efflux system protein
MARDHAHSHTHGQTGRVLLVSMILTLAFVAAEALVGWRAGSLALVSDAGHNFIDAFGLLLAAAGFALESRPGDHVKTFGYHRAGVLAAFINSLLMGVLSLALFYESYQRFRSPQPVVESAMIWMAAIGLALNLAIAWGLGGHGGDLNVRAAWIHMLGDAAGCVGIIIGAVVIHYTGWLATDPVLAILIGVAILWTSWGILRDSLNILLEGLPKGVDLLEVSRELRGVGGVIDVHDLHIWSLGSEAHALSCHVLIEDMPPSESESILRAVNRVLHDRFAIHHSTVQFEHTRCALADVSCTAPVHRRH